MRELVKAIAKARVDHPEEVHVNAVERGCCTVSRRGKVEIGTPGLKDVRHKTRRMKGRTK